MKKINSDDVPLNSDLLRTFLAVVRHRNVTHAAEAIHRTQSAVSVQIKRLEERLNTKLFLRESRGVSLTEAGKQLQQEAERIIRDIDQVAATFKCDPMGGIVRVGIPDDYGSDVLPGILSEFAAQHPLVEVYVRCEFGTDLRSAVEQGDLDLAVWTQEGSSIDAPTFFEEQTVWACAQRFVIDRDQSIPLALFDRSCWWRNMAIDALEQAGLTYRIAYSSESVSGVKAAISSGLAVGILSRSTVESSMRVMGIKDGLPGLPRTGLSLLQHSKTPSASISAMADAIRHGFPKIEKAT
ncbi:MAG: LysR substrate-binding domain-containing protein [Rhodospirillales bacterium]|nr:LysR substrate-binding domain-containing protein [Rhodospirillales bacterium]